MASTATPDGKGDKLDTKLQLPPDVKLYLRHRAVEENSTKPSISRVIIDIVRREMAREQEPQQ